MAFGYAGDATGDSASLSGTGAFSFDDPARGGKPMVPLADAALKAADAEEIYHVKPGETFVNPADGKTYRYADVIPDWSPAKPGYVDVYDPGHPPDSSSAKLARAPGHAPDTSALQESPEPPAETPEPDTETPVDKAKRAFPEMGKWKIQDVQEKFQQWFPDVPKDRLAIYMQQPGGSQLIQQYQERNKTPLERFRDLYPQRATGDTEKDIQAMHDWLEPDTPIDQFRIRANPPGPVMSALGHALDSLLESFSQVDRQFRSGVSAFAQSTVKGDVAGAAGSLLPGDLPPVTPQGKGFVAGKQQAYGDIQQFPKRGVEGIKFLMRRAGIRGWQKDATAWMENNVPAYGGSADFFRHFIKHLAERGAQSEQQAGQIAATIPKDPSSQLLGGMGQIAGLAPSIALSYWMGVGPEATAFGMLYEGTSAWGDAVEHHQKNALMQGVTAGGFRLFAGYLFNTNAGRIVTGLAMGAANAGQEEFDKWLRGEPNDITKDGNSITLTILLGLLGGGPKWLPSSKPEPSVPETTALLPGVQPEQPPKPPQTEQGPAFSNEWSFSNHEPAVREELQKAQEAHEQGDVDIAIQHFDKALVFMPDKQKSATAAQFIPKVDELAGKTPKDEYFQSGPWRPGRHNKFAKEENAPHPEPLAIRKLREINPEAADRYAKMPPKEQASYLEQLKSSNPQWNPENGFNDHYFAGIPFPSKAIKEWFDEEMRGLKAAITALMPDTGSKMRKTAAQIIRKEFAASKEAIATVPPEMSRRHGVPQAFQKIENILHGDQADIQRRYINTRSSDQQVQDLIDYQNGKPIKDQMTQYLYENMHRPLMDGVLRSEHAYGIPTPAMLNYVQHSWTRPEELPKLQAAMKRYGIDPSFVKPQQMDIATGVAIGFNLKDSNIVNIDRMRLLMSEFVKRQIRILRQFNEHGYAWESTRKDIPQQYRNNELKLVTANQQSWFLHPDLIPLWNNAFDLNNVFDVSHPISRFIFKQAGKLKGFAAWKVSFGGFHPLHITGIRGGDIANKALWRMRHGETNWQNAMDLATGLVPVAGDIYHTARGARRYQGAVSYLQGHGRFEDLDPDMQRATKDFIDMGLTVDVNQERALQFMRFFERQLPQWEKADKTGMVKIGAQVLGMGFNGFNHWWFHDVTPNLKFSSAIMRRDALMLERPELFKPVNRPELLQEYGKIHRDIEGRYGEMNYENLFQPRLMKQIGTVSLLSYGWQLGMVRVMGDGVIDTTTNAAHWQQLVSDMRARRAAGESTAKAVNRAIIDPLLNERLSYTAIYLAKALLFGWAISMLKGGKKPDELTLQDGVYPLVGKDASGKEQRVNTQYFFKEIPSYEHYAQLSNDQIGPLSPGALMRLGAGKLNPMWNAISQALTNKDYMDKSIGTLPDRMWYLLKQGAMPISFENALVPGSGPTEWIQALLGFAPSGKWTMRSDTENAVMADYVAEKSGPKGEARDEYRQAFLNKDQGALKAAHERLKGLGATEKEIHHIQKDANVPTAMKVFNQLPKSKQLEHLRKMTPVERAKWLKHASPEVRHQVKALPGLAE